MGHTNSTVNYNLPQFVGTDKPTWMGDVNGAFLAIDTAIAAAKTQADSAAGGVAGLQTTVSGHTTQIGTLTDTVTAQGGTLNSVTSLIGNGTPTAGDHTIIGAINTIDATVNALIRVESKSGGETAVAANTVGSIEVNIEKDGYTPVAIATFAASASHNEDVNIFRAVFNSAKTKAILGVKNNNAASQDVSAAFTILYVKTGLV